MSLVRILIILVELLLLIFLMLMAFITTSWIEHDSFAATATEMDWWLIAGERLIVPSIFSVIAAVVMWQINKPLFVWSRFDMERLPMISGIIVFVGLFMSALGGAVYFVLNKPYM